MNDYNDLRTKAEAAGMPWDRTRHFMEFQRHLWEDAEFIAACSPEVVIGLLDRIAALEALVLELAHELVRVSDVLCDEDCAIIDAALSSPLLAELRAKAEADRAEMDEIRIAHEVAERDENGL